LYAFASPDGITQLPRAAKYHQRSATDHKNLQC